MIRGVARTLIALGCAMLAYGVPPAFGNDGIGPRNLLWERLAAFSERDAFLFGYQNANVYGLRSDANNNRWTTYTGNNLSRSDTHDLVGKHPAIFGFNPLETGGSSYSHYPSRFPHSEPNLTRPRLVERIQDAHRRGGIVTLYFPLNFVAHEGEWIVPTLQSVQRGGIHREALDRHLNDLASFLDLLQDDAGRPIPFIFRPWHEYTGNWNWWEPEPNATDEARFIALFRHTVDYLRGRDHRQFLVALAPAGHHFAIPDRDFFFAYPGDDYVDIYTLDMYFVEDRDLAKNGGGYTGGEYQAPAGFWKAMNTVIDAAESKAAAGIQKLVAISEFGVIDGIWSKTVPHPRGISAETQRSSYYATFLQGMKANISPDRRKLITYAMTWRNGGANHGWIPVANHPGAADFQQFLEDPMVAMLDEAQLSPQEVWRHTYFGTILEIGESADPEDPDGDGRTNREEYILGTDPTVAEAAPLLELAVESGVLTVTFAVEAAIGPAYDGLTRFYDLETTNDLTDPDSWRTVPRFGSIAGDGRVIVYSQRIGDERVFYRLRVHLE